MNRKEFLSSLGLTAVGILCAECLEACHGPTDAIVSAGVDFTLDLTAAANAGLAVAGGYIYRDGVIVAQTIAGSYIAVSKACTHAGTTVQFIAKSSQFYCPNHGSTFMLDGSVVNGPAAVALTRYSTRLTGTNLRVYS